MASRRCVSVREVPLDGEYKCNDVAQVAQQIEVLNQQEVVINAAVIAVQCQNQSPNPRFVEDDANNDLDNPFAKYGPR